jgi:hypothetical protein
MKAWEVIGVRVLILAVLLGATVLLLSLAGCTGAMRGIEAPLGPIKGDRFPACEAAKKNCEKT